LVDSEDTIMRRLPLIAFILTLASSALAQTSTPANTNTPTNTATNTNTPTNTPTPTLMRKATEGATDFRAFQHGSFRFAPTPNCDGQLHQTTFIIPGLKRGDLIITYPPANFAGVQSPTVIGNNQLQTTISCGTVGNLDWEYVWFSRTQNDCKGVDNCKPASTVTATPTNTPGP
jgi:hypothetical protein